MTKKRPEIAYNSLAITTLRVGEKTLNDKKTAFIVAQNAPLLIYTL